MLSIAAGNSSRCGCSSQVALGGRELQPPRDRRQLQTHPEERQRRLGGDDPADQQGAQHEQRGDRVRQHVPEQQPAVARAERPRGDHVVGLPGREHRRAHQPGAGRPREQRQHGRDRPHRALAEDGQDDDRPEQEREAQEDVGQPGHDGVRPAAVEAGHRAGDRRHDEHRDRRQEPDRDRVARPVDHVGVQVTALDVVAERVPALGPLPRLDEVADVRVAVPEQPGHGRRERRDEQHEHDDQRRDDERRAAPQRAPQLAPAPVLPRELLGLLAGPLALDRPLAAKVSHSECGGRGRRTGRPPGGSSAGTPAPAGCTRRRPRFPPGPGSTAPPAGRSPAG